MRPARALRLLPGLAAGLLLAACTDADPVLFGEPAAIEAASALSPEGTVGEGVPEAPRVRVVDARGNPAPGASVRFQASQGSSVAVRDAEADERGFASPGTWTLGTIAGSYELRASIPNVGSIDFGAEAAAGPADSLRISRGQGIFGTAGAPLEILPQVTVTDRFGNPVTGESVTFVVTGGGGTIEGGTVTTDGSGRASPERWTLGTQAGPQSVEARSGALAPASFSVTATAAQPDSLALLSFEAPSPVVGETQGPIVVELRDRFGNAAGDQPIQTQILTGGGSVSPAQPRTDETGRATLEWTLGPTAGTQRLRVRSGQTLLLDLEVEAGPGPLDRLLPLEGLNQVAPVGTSVPTPPGARAVDSFGNPVSGVSVSFSVTAGGGTIEGSPATSASDGFARLSRWTLGPQPGENRVEAANPGTEPAVFTAQAVESEPRILEVTAGMGQEAAVDFPVSSPPTVRVTSSEGMPVQGAEVSFVVIEGGGSVSPSTTTTDAEGRASVASWVMGPQPGTNRLRVDAENAPSVTVTATAREGFQLRVEEVHLNQGSQTFPASIPTIADRAGLLRVFVRANRSNDERPDVTIRFYDGDVQVSEQVVPRLLGSVPLGFDPNSSGASWNVQVPAEIVRPGLGLRVVVDEPGEVDVVDRDLLVWPEDGSIHRPEILETPTFAATFVRIISTFHGTTANLTAGNLDDYMRTTRDLFPIGATDIDIRAQDLVVEHGPLGGTSDASGTAWNRVLQDVQALRMADVGANPNLSNRYYHGIVQRPAGAGIAGLAYVASNPFSNALSAVSFDAPNVRSDVVAHEFGHNFGRLHAPCGNPGGLDPGYPHPNATIGHTGYLARTNTIIRSDGAWRDIMSYCDPVWASDYTFDAVMQMRLARPGGVPSAFTAASSGPAGASDGLLIWGEWSEGAGPQLLPAVAMRGVPPAVPTVSATVRGYDAQGALLFAEGVEGLAVDHADDPTTRHFTHFVPLAPALRDRLHRIELDSPIGTVDRTTEVTPAGLPVAPLRLEIEALPAGAAGAPAMGAAPLRIRWNEEGFPLAVIRDGESGRIISFARSGEISLPRPAGASIEVLLSDGVRTFTERRGMP